LTNAGFRATLITDKRKEITMNKKLYKDRKHWVEYFISIGDFRNAWFYFKRMIESLVK